MWYTIYESEGYSMSEDEREEYMKVIQDNLSDILFTRLILLLTDLDTHTTDMLIEALANMFMKKAAGFWYKMTEEATIQTISIVREVIDLLDGWVITSYADWSYTGTLAWHVSPIQ
jgi:hypothetical protein